MNDEQDLTVSVAPDTGIERQWGRGLFYRDDGRKRTLVSRNVVIAVGAGFGLVGLLLMIQPQPEPERPNAAAGFLPPGDVAGGPVVNVPQAAEAWGITPTTQATGTPGSGVAGGGATRKGDPRFRGPQLIARPRLVKIPPGSMLKAVLLSGASNGPVRAEVTESLSANGERVIESGTILLGQGQSGEDRLVIRFSQMIFKDGAVETIDAQACDDSDKIPGLKGSKVGNQAVRLATGIGLNFAGGMAEALQDSSGQNGAVVRPPTLRNAMLNGAATAALDQSREILSNTRNKPPVIEIPAGVSLFVLFSQ